MADILIDIGNSALKWALNENGVIGPLSSLLHQKADLDALEYAWQSVPKPERILISNVVGAEMERRISDLTQRKWAIAPIFAKTRSSAYGVSISYQEPRRLGVDRWLVLIATHQQGLSPAIVVDCGTAVTLDAIDADGVHRGGLIIPGLRMMWDSLFSNTRIPPIGFGESTSVLGKNTNECISSGALQAVSGMIEATGQSLRMQHGLDTRVVLTGSDAQRVGQRLHGPFEHRPLLLLEGLNMLRDEQ